MELPGALLSPSSKNKKKSTLKKFLKFFQKSFSYSSGNGSPEEIPYISGKGTF